MRLSEYGTLRCIHDSGPLCCVVVLVALPTVLEWYSDSDSIRGRSLWTGYVGGAPASVLMLTTDGVYSFALLNLTSWPESTSKLY
jgi:hypothetical protein